MSTIHIALLGYGTVGKGVYKTIENHQNRLKSLLGKHVKVVAILVQNRNKHHLPDPDVLLTTNFDEVLSLPKLDVVIDAIVGKEPGFTYLKKAIQKGCHVITANKEMFAYHGNELLSLAMEKHVTVGFEATVAGGIPIIQTLRKLLNVNHVWKIQGILNSTCNFILSCMREQSLPFSDALDLAKKNGYAEADPTNDIEGFDAFYKAMVLSEVVFGKQPKWDAVTRKGISHITAELIQVVQLLGLRIKHVVTIKETVNDIQCNVEPVLVSKFHPLFQVEYVQNAISIDADIVGNISLQGPGAGMFPTASAVLEDLVHIQDPSTKIIVKESSAKYDEEEAFVKWLIILKDPDKAKCLNVDVIGSMSNQIYIVQASEEDMKQLESETGLVFLPLFGKYELSEAAHGSPLFTKIAEKKYSQL